MAEGTSSKTNSTVIVLSITTAVAALAAGYFGYQAHSMNKEIRQLHDNINALAAQGTTLPSGLIPPDLLTRMNQIKAA